MVALQHTFGILLIVCCATVALSQRRKASESGRTNYYEEAFDESNDAPGNSGENLPDKYGRTIYQSAWPTEDMESNEEQEWNYRSTRERLNNKKPWSLPNLLRLSVNYVNRLKGESARSITEKNRNKNFPNSKSRIANKDLYLRSFKKWLRKNKILNSDDSISSDFLKRNFHIDIYNHRGISKSRKIPYKNFNSSRNKNKNHNKNRNRVKNSKSNVNDKHGQRNSKRDYREFESADETVDRGFKYFKLGKTNPYDTFNKKNREFPESLYKNEHKDFNEFINTNRNNKLTDEEEIDDLCFNTSTEAVVSSSSESVNDSHRISKKHHDSETYLDKSKLNEASTNNQNKKNVETTKSNNGQETSLNKEIHADMENISLNREKPFKYPENLKQLSKIKENLSFNSSIEVKNQENENGEKQGKYESYLQYIYDHSNNTFFKSLRNQSKNI